MVKPSRAQASSAPRTTAAKNGLVTSGTTSAMEPVRPELERLGERAGPEGKVPDGPLDLR